MNPIPLNVDPIHIDEAILTQGQFFVDLGERSQTTFELLASLAAGFGGAPSAASYTYTKWFFKLYKRTVNRSIFTFGTDQARAAFLTEVKALYGSK